MLINTKFNSHYFYLLKHHLYFVSMADGEVCRQVMDFSLFIVLTFYEENSEK